MFQFILSLFRRKRKKFKAKHYFQPHKGIWNYFRIFVFFFSLFAVTSFAAPINWEVTNLGNTQNRVVYGLVGDTAFRDQVLASIQNNTFSSLMASNPGMSLGNYIVPTTGTVKSGNITIPNNAPYSMYVVIFDSTSSTLYTYADVAAIQTKNIKKTLVTFTFDSNTTTYSRIYSVPEPNVVFLLLLGSCIFLISRP